MSIAKKTGAGEIEQLVSVRWPFCADSWSNDNCKQAIERIRTKVEEKTSRKTVMSNVDDILTGLTNFKKRIYGSGLGLIIKYHRKN